MKRSSTPSFILTLKLNTSRQQDAVLNDRFFAGWIIRNQVAKYALKQYHKLNADKEFQRLLDEPRSKERTMAIEERCAIYGLSESQLQHWSTVQQQKYSKYIDSNTVQKIATRVRQGVSACIYKDGEEISICSFANFQSMEGKNNIAGIKYRNGYIDWIGEHIAVQIRHDDIYAKESLKRNVKYCRILRKPVGQRYHYYVQLILEGIPPQKHTFLKHGAVGIDPGVSTEAIVTKDVCILSETAPERKDLTAAVAEVQRMMDASRRVQNPENFNTNGTVKKSAKKWHKSKKYKKLQTKAASIRRKNSSYVKQEEERLANLILETLGSDIITEKINYKALQKRKKRKRYSFGKSLAKHSPSRFLSILNRKLGYIGKEIFYVDTEQFKASQYDHVSDSYEKCDINIRSKMVGNDRVQRDLYSAFLLLCADDETNPNRDVCISLFPEFLANQAKCINAMQNDSRTFPSSFGLKDFI